MHVARPKSSKGRTRPTGCPVQGGDGSGCHSSAFNPHPPASHTTVRPRTVLHRSSKPSADILMDVFESPLDVPVLSLNKYKVLPSIEKRPAGSPSTTDVEDKTSKIRLSDTDLRMWQEQLPSSQFLSSQAAPTSDPEMDDMSEVMCGPAAAHPLWVVPGHAVGGTGVGDNRDTDLLLAVRSPCGQRFTCLFRPTDMLHAVVAAAEAKSGLRYEHAVIETMDVPRRTFKNLTMTLTQCGIFTKSVLCISLEDSTTDTC
ncbi:UBX domain-containing protein 10 [Brachyhypopomus gauderio]|uniref:UBX domain-containing protein 10 n=1 Tax=Brachyhypopomus gauderio TaxID=698409 RepID=UPI00404257D6